MGPNFHMLSPVCVAAMCRSTTAAELETAANQLLAMCQAGLPAPVSYNVVMTQTFLLMVPRRQELCGRAAIK
jgi:ATP adenylyltransferase/5',5'''-P-1,P-4-tetraphosphate phosphorylase II